MSEKSERPFTQKQKDAVDRIKKCKVNGYYEILNIQKGSSDVEIKKAYRKVALTLHPDKNSAPGADEAFKLVSKAFQVLSDPDKKRIYDATGADPDNRFSAASSSSNSGASYSRTANQFQGGIPPEELFNMFFGRGGGDPFGDPFGDSFGARGGATTFTFGGPGGVRFTTNRPRAAAPRATSNTQANTEGSFKDLFRQLLPILLFLVLPLVSNFLFSDSSPADNTHYSFEPVRFYNVEHTTGKYKVPYFVKKSDVESFSQKDFRKLDKKVEERYVTNLRRFCQRENAYRQQKISDSQGWIFYDQDKYDEAINIPTPNCDRLSNLGLL